MAKIQISSDWLDILKDEFEKPYMQKLREFLLQKKQQGIKVFPPTKEVFSSLNLTPFSKTKVVILGQDPYHGYGQGHGLAFSVKEGVKIPPSLVNIYKELKEDLDISIAKTGFLQKWATQGVLLLNTVLSVDQGVANSHKGKGWEELTQFIVEYLSKNKTNLIFVLWGADARKKAKIIDEKKHLIIQSAHPSPLSAYRGFFGSKVFSRTNIYLKDNNAKPIDWRVE